MGLGAVKKIRASCSYGESNSGRLASLCTDRADRMSMRIFRDFVASRSMKISGYVVEIFGAEFSTGVTASVV
jgi:hypothetical protein